LRVAINWSITGVEVTRLFYRGLIGVRIVHA
jgi:hypothetical protein